MNKELIIATSNRDYEWIRNIDQSIRVSVYRKGSSKPHTLENYLGDVPGRCVHSFFSHFYLRYDSLSDFTFTSQDFPFDHVSNYIDIINSDIDIWNSNSRMNVDNKIWFFNSFLPTLSCDIYGKPHHQPEYLPISDIWSYIFEDEVPNSFIFCPSGHFCISKDLVLQRPKDFYKKIINILENEPLSPWCIERLFPYIFSGLKIK